LDQKPSHLQKLKKRVRRELYIGIYIGNNHFIHASDNIHINSVNPVDELYDKFNAGRYLRSKRYITDGKVMKDYRMMPRLIRFLLQLHLIRYQKS
jgi:hypothetical protein